MDMPTNEAPEAVSSLTDAVLGLISAYGWHVVFFIVVANLAWAHVRPKIQKWKEKKRQQELDVQYQQNPERLISMQEGLERARQRLQEDHDRLAREHAEKMQEMEEEKRLEKIKKWESVQKGTSLKRDSPTTSADELGLRPRNTGERLRGQEYNPLMGSGSGTTFRSSRSSSSRGG